MVKGEGMMRQLNPFYRYFTNPGTPFNLICFSSFYPLLSHN